MSDSEGGGGVPEVYTRKIRREDSSIEPELVLSESVYRRSNYEHQAKKVHTLFTLGAVRAEKFDPIQVDILCAVYNKSQGFITPFHTELWSESWMGPSKEGFMYDHGTSTQGEGKLKAFIWPSWSSMAQNAS